MVNITVSAKVYWINPDTKKTELVPGTWVKRIYVAIDDNTVIDAAGVAKVEKTVSIGAGTHDVRASCRVQPEGFGVYGFGDSKVINVTEDVIGGELLIRFYIWNRRTYIDFFPRHYTPPPRPYSIRKVTLSASKTSVAVDEPVTISVTIEYDPGTDPFAMSINRIYVNGEYKGYLPIMLERGVTVKSDDFQLSFKEPGTYSIYVESEVK